MHVVIVIETCRVVYALGISVLVCMYKYYYQEHYLLGQMVTPMGRKSVVTIIIQREMVALMHGA